MAKGSSGSGGTPPRRASRGRDPSELGGLAPAGEIEAYKKQQERIAPKQKGRGGRRTTGKDWTTYNAAPVDLNVWNAAVEKFGEEVEMWAGDTYRDFATDVFVGIHEKTPVLSGRAQANWQVIKGSRPGTTSIPGPPFPDPIPAALATIASAKPGQKLMIFNNVVYISLLEAGYSTQAPTGMVAVTVAEVSAKMGGYIDALDVATSFEDLEEGEMDI